MTLTHEATVLVFRTNLKRKKDIRQVSLHLNGHQAIARWNVATDDVDRILRVEVNRSLVSSGELAAYISNRLKAEGFECEELV